MVQGLERLRIIASTSTPLQTYVHYSANSYPDCTIIFSNETVMLAILLAGSNDADALFHWELFFSFHFTVIELVCLD